MNALSTSKRFRKRISFVLRCVGHRLSVFLLVTGFAFNVAFAQTKDVAVTLATGETVSGSWIELQEDSIVIGTAGDEREISLADVVQLKFDGPKDDTKQRDLITLVDGTQLRWGKWQSDRKTFQGTPAVGLTPLVLPGDRVRSIRRPGVVDQQWDEIAKKAATESDAVVVQKETQLDWVDAVIRECSSEQVRFSFQGREVNVGIQKVAGLLFFQTPDANDLGKASTLIDRYGQRWVVASWEPSSGETQTVEFTTVGGVPFQLQPSDIRQWNFAELSRLSLSSRQPDQFEWLPVVPLAGGKHLKVWNAPQLNHSFDGQPIRILESKSEASAVPNAEAELLDWVIPRLEPAVEQQWTEYTEGLALKMGSTISYRLEDHFQRLTGKVGLAPPLERNQRAQVVIEADQKVVFQAELDAEVNPSRSIDVAIANPDRLTISVQFLDNGPAGDTIHFGQLQLLK